MIVKFISYLILILCILASFEVGWKVYIEYQNQQTDNITLYLGHWAMDFYAIIIIYLFSFCFNNLSFFDAYWSLMPPYRLTRYYMMFYWNDQFQSEINIKYFIFHLLILIWGLRLFIYIFRRWQGFPQQDSRINYLELKLRKKQFVGPILYWCFGASFIALVNAGVLTLLTQEFNNFILSSTESDNKLTQLQGLGLFIMFLGIFFESQSDYEMYQFKIQNKIPKICDEGLRRYCRFPQFFGEALFWWGVWLANQQSYGEWNIPFGAGLLSIWLIWQSVILNNRMMKKVEYIQYAKKVKSWWIPFFRF